MNRTRRRIAALALGLTTLLGAAPLLAQDRFITMASTTSTEQSGLFPHLLPAFKKASGIDVRVVAVGTGQALDIGRRGDADVLFVHDQAAEEKFVAEGFGVKRSPVMYNDFVIVGPRSDPAGARGKDVVAALQKIAASKSSFVSRGDRSGTHAAELRYWKAAGIEAPDAKDASRPFDYKACGCGMGPALNIGSSSDAYALTDRGTWLSFANKDDFKVLVDGDPKLFNQYGVILVNPAKHPSVKAKEGQAFIDWLTGSEGQAAIASYNIDGQQLFFPNARPQS